MWKLTNSESCRLQAVPNPPSLSLRGSRRTNKTISRVYYVIFDTSWCGFELVRQLELNLELSNLMYYSSDLNVILF